MDQASLPSKPARRTATSGRLSRADGCAPPSRADHGGYHGPRPVGRPGWHRRQTAQRLSQGMRNLHGSPATGFPGNSSYGFMQPERARRTDSKHAQPAVNPIRRPCTDHGCVGRSRCGNVGTGRLDRKKQAHAGGFVRLTAANTRCRCCSRNADRLAPGGASRRRSCARILRAAGRRHVTRRTFRRSASLTVAPPPHWRRRWCTAPRSRSRPSL